MEIYQLRYFEEVVKQKSYRKAAATFDITQSALSISLKKLEAELDVTLFEKNGRDTVLTEAGEMLRPTFLSILNEENIARHKADEYNRSIFTRCRFGIPMDLCDDLYFAVKKSFPMKGPVSPIEISQLRFQEVLISLCNDELDVAMILKPTFVRSQLRNLGIDSLTYEHYRTSEGFAYMSPDHSLARSDVVTPKMLAESELLISGRNEGLSGLVIWYLEENLQGDYIPIKRDMVHSNITLKTAEEHGIVIMPKNLNINGYRLVRRPIDPPLEFEVVVAWKKSRHMTDIQQQLIDFIVKYGKSSGY